MFDIRLKILSSSLHRESAPREIGNAKKISRYKKLQWYMMDGATILFVVLRNWSRQMEADFARFGTRIKIKGPIPSK
jgi:hypothetical protein